MIAAIIATTKIPSILGAFKFISVFFAGLGTVLIARWFWWRVNAQTELFALWATILIAIFVLIFVPDLVEGEAKIDRFGLRILITTFGVAAFWIPFAFASSKTPNNAAITFHEKMQIGGAGWNSVAPLRSQLPEGIREWILVMAILICILLGTGKVLFHEWGVGFGLLVAAIVLMVPFVRSLKRA